MPTWQEIARSVQRHRDSTLDSISPSLLSLPSPLPIDVSGIPSTILTADDLHITSLAPEDLVNAISSGKLTAVDVTSAYLRRAALAQLLVNCVTELLPERALGRARELDAYLKETGKVLGPLHGVPISVKEHVGMKGLDLNAGFVSWVGRVAKEDSLILKILWDAGAVFHARTTEPQTLMHLETSNNLFGVTVNPYNRNLTSGGSSGGEGALVGMHGSCLGIGTDIGGSIRSPAANCGVFGLRPTSYRLPLSGLDYTMGGAEAIVGVIGPLSTSIAGINLFMQTILSAHPWLTEPSLIPLPWTYTPPAANKPLKIAVLWDDLVVRPHPPITRALEQLTSKLRASAPHITLVDWKPHDHARAWDIIATLYFQDGGQEEAEAIAASGEPWRPLSNWLLKEEGHVRALSVPEVWAWTVEREKYRAAYAAVWNATADEDEDGRAVDVILAPVGPGVAPKLDCAKYWGYTAQWNLLDYPALVFPYSKVDPTLDLKDESYVPRNPQDAYNHAQYDSPETYSNAPISLQIIARRYQDERTVEAFEVLRPYL